MKIKAQHVIGVLGILKTIDTAQMKLSTAHKVKKVLNVCQEAVGDFEDRRIAMAQKHGTLNKAKTHYDFADDDAQKAFQDDLQEMLDDELDMNFEKIPLSMIDDYITLAPASIDLVDWLIDFEK